MALRIVWFDQLVRVADHPALLAAASRGAVLPVFVWDPEDSGDRDDSSYGGARRWWLHGALEDLSETLQRLGSPLVIRQGAAADVLAELCQETGAQAVEATRPLDPRRRRRLLAVQERLSPLPVTVHAGVTLFAPEQLRTQEDHPYRVFTPFWKALRSLGDPELPHPAPWQLVPPCAGRFRDAFEGAVPSSR